MLNIFKIFEFTTSISFILAIFTVMISFAVFFILKRIRDNETKTNTLLTIVSELTNDFKQMSSYNDANHYMMNSGISNLNINENEYHINSIEEEPEFEEDADDEQSNDNDEQDGDDDDNEDDDDEDDDDEDDDDEDDDDEDDEDADGNEDKVENANSVDGVDNNTDDNNEQVNNEENISVMDDDLEIISLGNDIQEINEDNKTGVKVIELDEEVHLADLVKMTVKDLRRMVVQKKLHNDPSKLRKNELIKILEQQ